MKLRSLLILVVSLLTVTTGVVFVMKRAKPVAPKQVKEKAKPKIEDEAVVLLEEACVRCHGPEKQKGGLRLDSLEDMLKGGENGPAIVIGTPEKSLLINLIHHREEGREMPPKEKLRQPQIQILENWIASGAPWSTGPKAEENEEAVEVLGDAWHDSRNPIAKIFGGKRLDLWSIQKVSSPAEPPVKNVSWIRNPIDSFVLSKIEAAGKTPAPEAAKRTLGRRLYFDLTGLPPTPAELADFINDPAADAYEKLVTKLLDSPKYGEHWASFWLDVVRYSDSNGFDYDEFRPTAWRFRDYVIKSLNEDKPFDRFGQEQLAGDELVEGFPKTQEDQDALVATGYLRVGPYDNSAVKFGEQDRCHAQVMADIVETTGSAFLGLNLACCRCHDHKFDPVSTADYYRIRAVFEKSKPDDDLLLDLEPEQRIIQQQLAGLAEEQKKVDATTAAAYKRVEAQKIGRLAPSDQEFYAKNLKRQTPQTKGKFKTLKNLVQPSDAEVKEALTPEERKIHEQVVAEFEVLQKSQLPVTKGFLVTEPKSSAGIKTRILFQGDFTKPREIVAPGVLSVLNPNPLPETKTKRPDSSGARTAFAKWLFAENNPLTSRVFVNRLWQAHFGEGIQATSNDFGFAGARPTNPLLLDWLATRFRRDGWSIKKMQRLMVESATYRQAAGESAQDSRNLFLGQQARRLKAEAIRDSMLCVAGKLRPHNGGPPLWPELPEEVLSSSPGLLVENAENTRGWYPSPKDEVCVRSVYLVQKRSLRLPMLETFDLPENNQSCGRRIVSTVAPQALTLLNSPFAVEMAESFVNRLRTEGCNSPESQIHLAFALSLQRAPDADEAKTCTEFLRTHSLTDLCRAMMNLNEFAYVD